MPAIAGFDSFTFEHDGISHPVYVRGEGPAIQVCHVMAFLHGNLDTKREA